MTEAQQQFQKELKALIDKYQPAFFHEAGPYGDDEGITISVGEFIVAQQNWENKWVYPGLDK